MVVSQSRPYLPSLRNVLTDLVRLSGVYMRSR